MLPVDRHVSHHARCFQSVYFQFRFEFCAHLSRLLYLYPSLNCTYIISHFARYVYSTVVLSLQTGQDKQKPPPGQGGGSDGGRVVSINRRLAWLARDRHHLFLSVATD